MPSSQGIKRRITSVNNTRQITKAMDLVATSKLQKAKERLTEANPMFSDAKRIIDHLKNNEDAKENIFVMPRKVKNTIYVVITGDRGMCGAYNTNISREALALIDKDPGACIIALGVKGYEFFKKRGKKILRRYIGMAETAFYENAEEIGHLITSMYVTGEIDRVYVAYTKFESALSLKPRVEKVLPIGSVTRRGKDFMLYEPDVNTVLNYIAPLYVDAFIYGALLESSACEQAARMVSMDTATNNAGDIIDDLSLLYNRIRQSAVTQELNEIVSGANAINEDTQNKKKRYLRRRRK